MSEITRRTAIITSLFALGGTPIYAQQKTEEAILNTGIGGPVGMSISLDQITFLDVHRGKETVRVDADEIWKALND